MIWDGLEFGGKQGRLLSGGMDDGMIDDRKQEFLVDLGFAISTSRCVVGLGFGVALSWFDVL